MCVCVFIFRTGFIRVALAVLQLGSVDQAVLELGLKTCATFAWLMQVLVIDALDAFQIERSCPKQ